LCVIIWNGGDLSRTSMTSASDWWLLVRIPLAVALTTYSLLVLGKRDPGTQTAGVFTALYVQFVGYSWVYEPDWLRYLVLSTALVRVISILTGIIASFVVNMVASAFLLSVIFEKQFHNIHWLIDQAVEVMKVEPLARSVQDCFATLEEYEENLQGAIEELTARKKLCLGDESTKRRLKGHLDSCRADQDLLCIQQAISVLVLLPDLSVEEKNYLQTLFAALTRRDHLFPNKDLIGKLHKGNGHEVFIRCLQTLITRVEGHAPMSLMLVTDGDWFSQSRKSNAAFTLSQPQPHTDL